MLVKQFSISILRQFGMIKSTRPFSWCMPASSKVGPVLIEQVIHTERLRGERSAAAAFHLGLHNKGIRLQFLLH
jgi:hypothetical protein